MFFLLFYFIFIIIIFFFFLLVQKDTVTVANMQMILFSFEVDLDALTLLI